MAEVASPTRAGSEKRLTGSLRDSNWSMLRPSKGPIRSGFAFVPKGVELKKGLLGKQTVQKTEKSAFDKLQANKYQKRYFRLFPDVMLYYESDSSLLPDSLIPLETVLYVAHAEKEFEGQRFDVIIQGQDQWIFSLRADSKEEAADWVKTLKTLVEDAKKETKKYESQAHLRLDKTGKFWKKVMDLALVYHRRQHSVSRSSEHQLLNAVRSGELTKRTKTTTGSRQVELFLDAMVEKKRKTKETEGLIFIREVQGVTAGEKGHFTMEMKNGGESIVWKANTADEAEGWVAAINDCITKIRPLTDMEQKVISLQGAAQRALDEGDYQTALGFYEEAASIDPGNREIATGLERVQLLASEESKIQADRLSGESLALKNEGNEQFMLKNYEAALDVYSQALLLEPQNSLLYFNRSACYHKLKRTAEAVADAEKAVEYDLTNADAHSRLALVYSRERRFDKAVECYKSALMVDPENERAKRGLQTTLERKGKYEKRAASGGSSDAPTII